MFIHPKDPIEKAVSLFRESVVAMRPSCPKGIVWEVKKKTNTRTLLQIRFMFKQCVDVAKFLNEAGMQYDSFGTPIDFDEKEIHKRTKEALGVKTTKFDTTKEFSDYLERLFVLWIGNTNGFWQPLESTASYFEKNGYEIDDNGNIVEPKGIRK